MAFIRRHARLFSLLCVLAAAVAAPYMIPENPDSAVFRSGTLGMLLLCAAGFVVHDALRRADRRTLVSGLFWGFLFSCALSVGAELLVYDGLLPGMGSLLRRAAVPLLATPLIGGIAARLMLAGLSTSEKKHRAIPGWAFFAVIFICWLPLLLAYFPAMLNYDFPGEYTQHLNQCYNTLHPLLHSLLSNGIITLGEMLHSRTFGLLLMSLLRMTAFAASLAFSCVFVQRRGAPRIVVLLLTALYALHPIFSVMSLSMTKDTLFAACVLTLSLLALELLESPETFFAARGKVALFVLCTVGTALLRNNGAFVLVLLFPALLLTLRKSIKRILPLLVASIAVCLLINISLTVALKPVSEDSFQLYSLPAQQLVRAYNTGEMTQEEKEELEGWYTSSEGLVVHPHLADGAKGYLDRERIAEEGADFLRLWAQVGKRNIRVYVEALLMLNVGLWYPDDLSHASIYPDVFYLDKGYLQTQEDDMTQYGFHTTSFLPKVTALYERICRRNIYQKYPLISVLFCTATPLWVLLFACCRLVAQKRTRMLLPMVGVFGLWIGYLFGPCTLPRYVLPMFCVAPMLLALAYSHPTQKEVHS